MSVVTNTDLKIHHKALDTIRAHAQQQDAKGGFEAVGFIAAHRKGGVGVATVRLNNHAADPTTHYFVEPWEQFRAEKKLAESGYHILGVYHSHPQSEAMPSATDHKMSRPGEAVLIYSVVFDEFRAYRERDGRLESVEFFIQTQGEPL